MAQQDSQDAAAVVELPAGPAAARGTPRTRPAKPKRKRLPPYKLILHNDDVNTMEHVVQSIVALTPLGTAEAIRKMLEAHQAGVTLLLTTHKERGELYVQQFATMSLTTSLEQDS